MKLTLPAFFQDQCSRPLAAALALALGAAAPAAETAAESAREALEQMAELERRIDQLHRDQWEERNQLFEVEGSIESIQGRLRERSALSESGTRFLQDYREQALEAAAELDQRIEAELAAQRQARRGLELAAAALLAAEQAPARERLALALIHRAHHDRMLLASRRALNLEAERVRLAHGGEDAARLARDHSIFQSFGRIELEERHRELSAGLEQLRNSLESGAEELARLADQREQLRGLLAGLVEREAGRAAAPVPLPDEAAAGLDAEQQLIAAVEVVSGAAGAPGSEPPPLVTQSPIDEYGDGTRHLFWRAEPVGIRALTAGRVVFADPFVGYRHLLIIDHGDGWRALYGNLSRCDVAVGAPVTAGQVLGQFQSADGHRAEPFWFEVRQGADPIPLRQWPALPEQWDQRLFSPLD